MLQSNFTHVLISSVNSEERFKFIKAMDSPLRGEQNYFCFVSVPGSKHELHVFVYVAVKLPFLSLNGLLAAWVYLDKNYTLMNAPVHGE